MSEGYNRVILMGNLGADPELKLTQGGTSVLKLRVATSERYVDRNGDKQERTEWHTVVVWGKRAVAAMVAQYKAGRYSPLFITPPLPFAVQVIPPS